jgi:hypothetical protein
MAVFCVFYGPAHPEEEHTVVSTQAIVVLSHLLPDTTPLHLEACDVDKATAQITLQVRSIQTRVPCSLCAIPASRIHSRYERTLADRPEKRSGCPAACGGGE